MFNADELTEEEWDALTERQRAEVKADQYQAYLDECSPEQRARVEWENS